VRRWAVTVCAIAVVGVVGSVKPAEAGVSIDRWSDGSGVGSSVEVNSGTPGSGSGGNAPVCTYSRMGSDEAANADTHFERAPYTGMDPGAWFSQVCVDANGNSTALTVWFAEIPNDPIALAQQALSYAALPKPQVSLSPSTDALQIVNVPVWLSVDAASWKPVSASVSSGGTSVTTTATPVRVVWSTGDGSSVTCNGPGVAYDSSRPASQQRSDCTYVYKRSSAGAPGGAFTITATQTWNVTWTATGAPAGTPTAGGLAPVTQQVSVSVRVGEIQALNKRK
jgi:hypothetical protein